VRVYLPVFALPKAYGVSTSAATRDNRLPAKMNPFCLLAPMAPHLSCLHPTELPAPNR